jgi:hypothetical protein
LSRNSNLELPEEVNELYQWRNGDLIDEWDYVGLFDISHDFHGFGPWGFIPFQGVANIYMKKRQYYAHKEPETFSGISYFQSPAALEIFCCLSDGGLTGYVYKDETNKSFPVVFRDYKGGSDTVLRLYASLTDMMMTLAESYETAYYIGEDGYLTKDTNEVLEIWRKYNSNQLVEGVLNKIEQLEPILPQLEMGNELLKEVADILMFSRDRRLIEPLIRVLRRPPTNTQLDENLDYFRQMSSLYLGWYGGVDAVEPLINALLDEHWLTRYWVAITLGTLKDSRAVPPLIEILQDSQEMVRRAATEALSKITNPQSITNPIYTNPVIANLDAAAALYGMTLSDIIRLPDGEKS